MKIRVLHGWMGDTSQVILKGDYDASDPRLFGKADYLIQNRHAEVIEADDEQPETKPALDDLTVKQLKEMALEMELDITGTKSKADFIGLIEAAAGVGESAPTEDDPAADSEPAEDKASGDETT
jgi:hypothetical protein